MITVQVTVEHQHGTVEVVEVEHLAGHAGQPELNHVLRAVTAATGRAAERARCAVSAKADT